MVKKNESEDKTKSNSVKEKVAPESTQKKTVAGNTVKKPRNTAGKKTASSIPVKAKLVMMKPSRMLQFFAMTRRIVSFLFPALDLACYAVKHNSGAN